MYPERCYSAAASEVLDGAGAARKIYRLGICDRFAEGCGTLSEVRKMNRLDSESIFRAIMEVLH